MPDTKEANGVIFHFFRFCLVGGKLYRLKSLDDKTYRLKKWVSTCQFKINVSNKSLTVKKIGSTLFSDR